jgi:integration host factor subunit alpha
VARRKGGSLIKRNCSGLTQLQWISAEIALKDRMMSIQQTTLKGRQQFHADCAAVAPVSVEERAKLIRADLAGVLVRRIGLSRPESAKLLEMVLGEIGDALSLGERVVLSGFGTFLVRAKNERVGRNPKTGAGAKIGARNVLSFKSSPRLRKRVNEDRISRLEELDLMVAS